MWLIFGTLKTKWLIKVSKCVKNKWYKNLHLKFIGTGKNRNKCIEYAIKNNIDCEFINELKHSELLTFYN